MKLEHLKKFVGNVAIPKTSILISSFSLFHFFALSLEVLQFRSKKRTEL